MKLGDRPPWIIRTYAGFGDAETTNERFRSNLAAGQEGLSVAFDLPTQNGYDSDAPESMGEVGGTGVAVCHLGDLERLFQGIALDEVNTSMTINATAVWLYALYLALAEKQGVAWAELRGTTQNDLMKEFVARGTYLVEPELSLRLSTDLIEFAVSHTPKWNPINVCGYHYMESGARGPQEVGFAIGNALLLLDDIRSRVSAEEFGRVVRRISFFVNSGIELVPEIAKFRAYARLWQEVCRDRYGLEDVRFRAGCQVRSLTLARQQPEVNIIRIAYQALPAVLSASARVGALQLPGFREAIALPDQGEQILSLRTQQVLMYETGLTDHEDIFEGSKVIEAATACVMDEARDIVTDMVKRGYASSVPWLSVQLTRSLLDWQADVDRGEIVWVGVNSFEEGVPVARKAEREPGGDDGVERHLERLAEHRATRDSAVVHQALADFEEALRGGANVVESSIELARAGGTTGEWSAVVEKVSGGRYSAPLGADAGNRVLDVPQADRKIRVLLAKAGLDGHVNAVKLLAAACSCAGIEVVYSGLKQSPDAIVATAIEEDVDLVGISSLSGAHLHLARAIKEGLVAGGAADIPLVLGGIVPDEDLDALTDLGVEAIFTPGEATLHETVTRIIELARK